MNPIEGVAAPHPASTHGNGDLDRSEKTGVNPFQQVRLGNADERFGHALFETLHHSLDSHSGIDNHRDGADFEKGEGEREEFEARIHHQNGSRALFDADIFESVSQAVGFPIELHESQMRIGHTPVLIPTGRKHHRPFVGMAFGHFLQSRGDVDNA